jgi:FG-GAP-like repeat
MPLKMFLAACVLLVVSVVPSQAVAGSRRNVRGTTRGHQGTRPPVTIWERMRDPRGWWQSRFDRSNQPGANPRVRPPGSEVQPFVDGTITNPVFFLPPTYGSGGKFARNTEIGDFNGDGKPDLLISNQCVSDTDCTQGTIAVLLGNGDGTFQSALVSNTEAVLATVAIGDFNRDGRLDVAVDNACPDSGCTSGSVNILLGKGDGTFQPPVAYPSGGNAFSVEAGDINGDGKLDVIVVNGSNSAGVLLGNGDGTFKPVTPVTASTSGNSAVFLGEFNGDNKLDLAVVTSNCDTTPTCTRSVNVLLGNGDGTFGPPVGSQSSMGLNSQAVALGDVNGDGKLDLAIVDNCVPPTGTCGGEFVDVFLGNGDGTFKMAKSSVLSSTDVTFIGLADLNGDSKLDAVTVDPDAAFATVMLGTGDGTLQILNGYETDGASPLFGALGDLNGDGKTDVAVANACQVNFQNSCAGAVVALLGNGNGTLQAPPDYPVMGNSNIETVAVADFNGDGRPDLAELVINLNGPSFPSASVSMLLGNADGTFVAGASTAVASTFVNEFNTPLVAGDFNRDGKADLATTACLDQACTTVGLAVLLGVGDGTFSRSLLPPPLVAVALSAGDFNGDGKLDMASVTNTCTGPNDLICNNGLVNIWLGNGDGTFQIPVNYPFVGAETMSLVAGDLNLDGKLDLIVANSNCGEFDCPMGSVSVLLGNGDGTFQTAVNHSSGDFGANSLALADLNGDGKTDLAISNMGACFAPPCTISSIGVLLGKGDGSFQAASTTAAANNSGTVTSIAVADFDGDGKLDLALSNRRLMLGNGDGTFQDPQNYNLGTNDGVSEAVADFNGDGKPDLAVATSPFVAVLLNISSGGAQDFNIGATALSPSTISPGESSTSTITITAMGGFNGSVSLSCGAIVPAVTPLPSCSFNPSSVANGSGTATLLVSTTAPHALSSRSRGFGWVAVGGSMLAGIFLLGVPSRRRRRAAGLALMVLVFLTAGVSCGGSGSSGGKTGGTPAGSYTITVTATSSIPQLSHTANLVVTVQ